jgi:vitamin K-dependent gamma-carboxylase
MTVGPRLRVRALWQTAEAALLRPVDIAWLVAFRVAFGLTLCVSMLRFLHYGWVDALFVRPSFRFKYWGFAWVEPLSASALHGLVALLAALSFCVAIGALYRLTLLLFLAGFLYLSLLDVTNYLNHYYLAILLGSLLLVAPAHRAGSVDALLFPNRARSRLPAAYLYLIRFQVAVVYTFAGLAKAHTDWLIHAQPLGIWLGARTDLPLVGRLFAMEPVPLLMSWAGCLFDSTIAGWLSWKKTRPFAFVVVVLFHLATRALFPIGMFPVIMVTAALVFFSPEWPRRWLDRARILLHLPAAPACAANSSSVERFRLSRWGAGGLIVAALYSVAQVALPLRFLAYGGNVRWHEQGMRFSWRVMVREKNGAVTFLIRSKATGRTWQVSPERYLTRLQEREMSTQPDLILQLAHHVAYDFERRGLGPVEVRVDALVSLNGRRMSRLIDPNVDLTQVADGLGRAHWILPSPSEAPPHIHPI